MLAERYLLLRLLGKGGFSEVFQVTQSSFVLDLLQEAHVFMSPPAGCCCSSNFAVAASLHENQLQVWIVFAHAVGSIKGHLGDAPLGLLPLNALASSLVPRGFPRNSNLRGMLSLLPCRHMTWRPCGKWPSRSTS